MFPVPRSLAERPPRRLLIQLAVLGGAASGFFLAQLAPLAERLSSGGRPGLWRFELAFTRDRAASVLAAWSDADRSTASESLHLGAGWLVAYGVGWFSIILLLARRCRPRLRDLGLRLAVLQGVAVLLDAVENFQLLAMLEEGASGPRAATAGMAAVAKALIVGAGGLYVLRTGTPLLLLRRDS